MACLASNETTAANRPSSNRLCPIRASQPAFKAVQKQQQSRRVVSAQPNSAVTASSNNPAQTSGSFSPYTAMSPL